MAHKRLTALILCALLVFTALPFSSASADYEDPAVARVRFNLRQGRDLNTSILINIAPKSKLVVKEYYDDGWCKAVYRGRTGFALTDWLIFPEGSHAEGSENLAVEPTPAPDEPVIEDYAENDEPEEEDNEPLPTPDYTGTGWITPKATDAPVVPTITSFDPRIAEPVPCGVSIGESDTNEIAYVALIRGACSIREEPNDTSRRLFELSKTKRIHVLAYGDDWCKVQSVNGQYTGYTMTKFIYHFHSCDPFKYQIPWYDGYASTGYLSMTTPVHVTDHKDTYKGQNLQVGDIITVRKRDDGDYDFVLRRDWVTISEYTGEYHPFVKWNEAKAGDIIGGFTMNYGLTQGGAYKTNRKRNIALATTRMDGTVIRSGEMYSFLTNIGPVTIRNGYKVAGITGGSGTGTGGGICHTSSVTYSAALSVPFYIIDREPHTADGMPYTLLEFDATVGGYSDMSFYNTLPYDVREHCFHDKASGTITIMWECLETLDQEVLDNWDWKTLNIPKSPEEKNIQQ